MLADHLRAAGGGAVSHSNHANYARDRAGTIELLRREVLLPRETDMRKYLLAAVVIFAGGTLAHAQTLDQQERCAADAKRAFQEIRTEDAKWEAKPGELPDGAGEWSEPSAVYQSHYNTKIGKCLVRISVIQSFTRKDGHSYGQIMDKLIDANKRKEYAYFSGELYEPENQKTVSGCYLYPSSRETKKCKTEEEFDAFVDRYLEK